jgi:hypothetical protein
VKKVLQRRTQDGLKIENVDEKKKKERRNLSKLKMFPTDDSGSSNNSSRFESCPHYKKRLFPE